MRKGWCVSGFLLCLLLIGISSSAGSFLVADGWGWSNGGYSSDPAHPDYGTHDWIAQHALDWLPTQEKQFIVNNLAAYLYGTELPDNGGASDGIGDTILHHVYFDSTGRLADDAAAVRASTEYSDTLAYLDAKDYLNAARNAGIMSHYIADMAVFGHVMGASTDWGTEVHHSDYETYVNNRTAAYVAEFNSFLSFDGSLDEVFARDAATELAYDTTFDLDGDLTCVWMDQNYDWINSTFRNRVGESLNLAVNSVTDVLHTLYQEFVRDDVPPLTVHDYSGSWHTIDFKITLTATDVGSGVANTFYRINDGPIRSVLVDGQSWITTEAANNKLEYWSVDGMGNEESHHILSGIKLDKTAPSGSIIINGGAPYAVSEMSNILVGEVDTTSRVGFVRLSFDGVWDYEMWEVFSASQPLQLPAGDGLKTVYCQVKDNAGLISPTYSDTIILDTTPPSVSIIDPASGYETKSSMLTVAWIGSDALSSINHYDVGLDGKLLSEIGMNTTFTLTGLADGFHTFYVIATDWAGNTRRDTVDFVVNTSPLGGPGYVEEVVVVAAGVVSAIITIAYVRKKSNPLPRDTQRKQELSDRGFAEEHGLRVKEVSILVMF